MPDSPAPLDMVPVVGFGRYARKMVVHFLCHTHRVGAIGKSGHFARPIEVAVWLLMMKKEKRRTL